MSQYLPHEWDLDGGKKMKEIDEKIRNLLDRSFRSKKELIDVAKKEEKEELWFWAAVNYSEAGLKEKAIDMARKSEAKRVERIISLDHLRQKSLETGLELVFKKTAMDVATTYAIVGAKEDFIRLAEKYKFSPEDIKKVCSDASFGSLSYRLFDLERI